LPGHFFVRFVFRLKCGRRFGTIAVLGCGGRTSRRFGYFCKTLRVAASADAVNFANVSRAS